MLPKRVGEAIAVFRHRDIVGNVQHGRGGLGLGTAPTIWKWATSKERRQLVVEEVQHQEEAARSDRAVLQAQQGRWIKWDAVEQHKMK